MAIVLVAGVSAACGKKPVVKGVQAAKTSVESSVTTTTAGTVTADQQAVLSFGAVGGGGGRVARIAVNSGDRVKRGQILAELENADLETVSKNAEADLARTRKLFKAGLVSKVALDDARKAYDTARVNLDKSQIRAPFDGVITEMNLELGEMAQTTPVTGVKAQMRIVDIQPRIIKGDIDEIDLARVEVGTPARVKIQAVSPDWLSATVTKVIPFVSTIKEKDRTSEVELELTERRAELIPVGASADIEIITEQKDGVLAVPARTVIGRGGGQRHVFRFEGGVVHRRDVKTGIGNFERVQILSGISEGDVVAFPPEEIELKDGMKVTLEKMQWP